MERDFRQAGDCPFERLTAVGISQSACKFASVQRTGGLYRIFSTDYVYTWAQNLIGAVQFRQDLVEEVIQPFPGARILDIGCGPADMLEAFGDVSYTGFDSNPQYIEAARRRFGERGQFNCSALTPETPLPKEKFDRLLAVGLLHHLDDASCRRLFQLASKCMQPRASLVTVDPSYVENQSLLGRYLTSLDRGQNVRTPESYVELAKPYFGQIDLKIWSGKIRIPYTQTVLRCKRPHAQESSSNDSTVTYF